MAEGTTAVTEVPPGESKISLVKHKVPRFPLPYETPPEKRDWAIVIKPEESDRLATNLQNGRRLRGVRIHPESDGKTFCLSFEFGSPPLQK